MEPKYFLLGLVLVVLILVPLLIAMFENIGEDKVHNLGKVASFFIVLVMLYIFFNNMSPLFYVIILVVLVLLFQ